MNVQETASEAEFGPTQTQAASLTAQTGDQSVVEVAASNNAQLPASGQAQAMSSFQSEGSASVIQQASPSSASVTGPDSKNSVDAVPHFAATPVPDQAPREASELDLAAAESLSPESALASLARLQSPDQALPGLSAFQKRLHSMLPQLPTMEKLAKLSQEVCSHCFAVTAAVLTAH